MMLKARKFFRFLEYALSALVMSFAEPEDVIASLRHAKDLDFPL